MKVLITGGAGFIGSHIAQHALRAGHDVAIIDDLSAGKRENVPEGARFHQVSICDRRAVEHVFAETRPDVVSHQAAQASVAVSVREPVRDAEVNLVGSLNVLEACRAHGAAIVYASTGGALYGEVPEGTRATTDTRVAPLSPYGCSKLAFEQYVRAYGAMHGVRFNVLRYANVYGPRQDPHGEAGVVSIFMARVLAGEPLLINARQREGDPGCVRDYVFVDDVVRANLAALEGRLAAPVLNVGTGVATTTRELAEIIAKALDSPSAIEGRPPRAGDLERSVLDPGDFRLHVGEPVGLSAGVARTAAWFRGPSGRSHERH